MKHPYAELFTYKLSDMDLTLLIKHRDWVKWEIATSGDDFMVSDKYSYFLSLPKHAKCVLRLLNGGEIEITSPNSVDYENKVLLIHWHRTGWYMNEAINSRISSTKEKRWIVYNSKGVLQGEYKNLPENLDGAQCVEIEITVTE